MMIKKSKKWQVPTPLFFAPSCVEMETPHKEELNTDVILNIMRFMHTRDIRRVRRINTLWNYAGNKVLNDVLEQDEEEALRLVWHPLWGGYESESEEMTEWLKELYDEAYIVKGEVW